MKNSRIARENTQAAAANPEKDRLRAQLLAARHAIPATGKAAAEAALCAALLNWLRQHPVASLGVFHPIRQEPDLQFAYNALHAEGVHLSLPKIRDKDAPLEFIPWVPGDELVRDVLGTSVPPRGDPVRPQALLIPCLGFNDERIRLGYGGGFYDRTLAQSPRPLAIGVAYAEGRVDFTSQTHDIALDVILTEASVAGVTFRS